MVIPSGVKSIGRGAFKGSWSLETINIPKGITVLPKEVFAGCDLEKVIIPDSVEEIKACAFANCDSLFYVYIPEKLVGIDSTCMLNAKKNILDIAVSTTRLTSAKLVDEKVKLKWKKVSTADEYEIYRSTERDAETTTFTDKEKLVKGQKYYHKIELNGIRRYWYAKEILARGIDNNVMLHSNVISR